MWLPFWRRRAPRARSRVSEEPPAKQKTKQEVDDEALDREIEGTFPASDPPSITQPGGHCDPHEPPRLK
ncbi:MAG: hypothetical protein K1X64_16155 [Myxococcaceae bacterium]|nr:hypothetical protein [Myxococcaceae bacterium]